MDEKEKGYGADYGATLTVIGAPDKGKLREQRNATTQKIKLLSIAQIIYGIVFLGIGMAHIGVAAQGLYGFPLLNVGPWIIAIMMIVAGVVGIQLWRKGEEHRNAEDCPSILKQLIFAYWMINHMTNCCLIGWSTAFCFMSVGACASETSNNFKYCVPGKDANIALAAILGVFCLLTLAFVIPVYIIYGRNYKAFGISPSKCCRCCDSKC